MKTNFFQGIAHLHGKGTWKITAEFTEEKMLLVTVLLADPITGRTNTAIQPMNFRGTPQELDEGFFPTIAKPVEQVNTFFTNATEFQKGLDEAKAQLEQKAKAKTDATRQKTENVSDGKKLYEEKIKKVAELDASCKYEQALSELPTPLDYPDKKAELEKLRAELERKKAQLSLL